MPTPIPAWFWPWARWYLGVSEFKDHARDMRVRPPAPRKIPDWAWTKLKIIAPVARRTPAVVSTPTSPALVNAIVAVQRPGLMFVNAVDPHGYGAAGKRNGFAYASIQVSEGIQPLNQKAFAVEGWHTAMSRYLDVGAWSYFTGDDLEQEIDVAYSRASAIRATFFDANAEIGFKGDAVGYAEAQRRAEQLATGLRRRFGPSFPLTLSTYGRLDRETTIYYGPFIREGFAVKPQSYWHLRPEWQPTLCYAGAALMGFDPRSVALTYGFGERDIGYCSPTRYFNDHPSRCISVYPAEALSFAELDEFGRLLL